MKPCNLYNLGLVKYSSALELQKNLLEEKFNKETNDSLILLEHFPVITVGRAGRKDSDILISEKTLKEKGIEVVNTDRGGSITLHCPGQLVAYPIIDLNRNVKDIHEYFRKLEETVILTLKSFNINATRVKGYTGVWVGNKKITSIGVGVKKWVTYHGLSLNVNPDPFHLSLINPCGIGSAKMASMAELLNRQVNMDEVRDIFLKHFEGIFGFKCRLKFPPWIKQTFNPNRAFKQTDRVLNSLNLNTVCESAKCPNIYECFGRGTATFMILGTKCTRNCKFCSVESGKPEEVDFLEPANIAKSVKIMNLKHVVITSVTRDDLPDGGASQFVKTINEIKKLTSNTTIEVLIPDFKGFKKDIKTIVNASPNIIGHNIETVPFLYKGVRPQADYKQSLAVIRFIKEASKIFSNGIYAKSGLMLGLGETTEQVVEVLNDLRRVKCDMVTIGQYLQPSSANIKARKYMHPDEFNYYNFIADKMGFKSAFCGPLVRSSYLADVIPLNSDFCHTP